MTHAVNSVISERPSRRSVVRAGAWSLPVITAGAAVPAYAASCTPLTNVVMPIAGGTVSNGGLDYSTTYTPPAGTFSAPITMTVKASYAGSMTDGSEFQAAPLYRTINPVGGMSGTGLGLIQTVTGPYSPVPGRTARGMYAFSFSKPVTNLRIWITDIDVVAGDYIDMVELGGAWSLLSSGSGISGSGTQASPWRGAGQYADDTSGTGNVRVQFPGSISGFDLTYWNNAPSFSGVDRNQGIYVTGITFDYQPC